MFLRLLSLVVLLALGCSSACHAQPRKAKVAPHAAQPVAAAPAPQGESPPANSPPQPGWVAHCNSASREAPLECAIEQQAILTKTGQLLVLVNIRVAGDSQTPIVLVQFPLGLNLPAGIKLQVDEGNFTELQVRTCENRGCFANAPVSPELLSAMKSGKQLKVSFQNLNKETITVPMPLTDFAAAYDKIR